VDLVEFEQVFVVVVELSHYSDFLPEAFDSCILLEYLRDFESLDRKELLGLSPFDLVNLCKRTFT
jgi:hypothetical protein